MSVTQRRRKVLAAPLAFIAAAAVMASNATPVVAIPSVPEGRAYELVTPLEKGGGEPDRDFVQGYATSGAAADGNAVAFGSRNIFSDSDGGFQFPTYVSRRSDDGWATRVITPPLGHSAFGAMFPSVEYLSPNLDQALVRTDVALTSTASDLNGSWGIYWRATGGAGGYQLVSVPNVLLEQETDGNAPPARFEFAGASPDSKHVVFNSSRQLTVKSLKVV